MRRVKCWPPLGLDGLLGEPRNAPQLGVDRLVLTSGDGAITAFANFDKESVCRERREPLECRKNEREIRIDTRGPGGGAIQHHSRFGSCTDGQEARPTRLPCVRSTLRCGPALALRPTFGCVPCPEVARDRLRNRRLQKRAPGRAIRSRPATSITTATPTSCSLLLGEVHEVTAFRDVIVSRGIFFHYADHSASGGIGATPGDAAFAG